MINVNLRPVREQDGIDTVAALAKPIWEEHFTPLIGPAQVAYMVDKFQSAPAISAQLAAGYEYFLLVADAACCGYIGIHQEEGRLFLSKLYIKKEFRGRSLASCALVFLKTLSTLRGLGAIYLTCNKYNAATLAIYDHLGFRITDSQVADIGSGYVMDDYILTYEL